MPNDFDSNPDVRSRILPVQLSEMELEHCDARARWLREWISREREALRLEIERREREIDNLEMELKTVQRRLTLGLEWRDVLVQVDTDLDSEVLTVRQVISGDLVWRRQLIPDDLPPSAPKRNGGSDEQTR